MGESCLRKRGFSPPCSRRREILLFCADRLTAGSADKVVQSVEPGRTRLQGAFDLTCHAALGGGDIILMHACGDGGEDRRAERAALIGGDDLQRPVPARHSRPA